MPEFLTGSYFVAPNINDFLGNLDPALVQFKWPSPCQIRPHSSAVMQRYGTSCTLFKSEFEYDHDSYC